jgi:SAM-dependent methyltransferase
MSHSTKDGDYFAFYNENDPLRWGRSEMPAQREVTERWLRAANVPSKALVVELGCGVGALRDVHPNYIGVDFSLRALLAVPSSTPRLQGDMQRLSLRSDTVGFLFSWAALEHVPRPELALEEIARVVRPGGCALLAPAWNVRPWAARALPIRPYAELSLPDRIRKASIPVRNSFLWRALASAPGRLLSELQLWLNGPVAFRYRRLTPNMTRYVYTDSDAFSSMDPHAALIFFLSRGWDVMSHPGFGRRIRVRHEALVVRKPVAP